MNPEGCPIHPFNTLRSLKAYNSIYMSLNTLDLPPFDHILNRLECVVHCGHLMRQQPVISEFKVAISKKCWMNPGFTLHPKLEYLAPIWSPYCKIQIQPVEKVQRTAARWTCRRWRNTSSAGEMLDKLQWPTLDARRDQSSLLFFHKIHCGTWDYVY